MTAESPRLRWRDYEAAPASLSVSDHWLPTNPAGVAAYICVLRFESFHSVPLIISDLA